MLSRFFIQRPKFALVISIILTLAGAIALAVLPVAEYPKISPPSVKRDRVLHRRERRGSGTGDCGSDRDLG